MPKCVGQELCDRGRVAFLDQAAKWRRWGVNLWVQLVQDLKLTRKKARTLEASHAGQRVDCVSVGPLSCG
jgi:hypothetical protein